MEAAALVAPPTRNLLVVTTDTREAELSWLGAKLVWLLVAVLELIISTANFTFSQVGHPLVFCSLNAALKGPLRFVLKVAKLCTLASKLNL